MRKYAAKPQKKRGMRGFIIFLAIVMLLLAAVVAAGALVAVRYHIISGKLYPKDAVTLDLRDEDLKPVRFEKIREKLPDCEILWNIPFQGGTLANDVTEVTVTSLSEKDIEMLAYAEDLKTVHAENCRDYDQLARLCSLRPEVDVRYSVHFSAESYDSGVELVMFSSVTEEDIHLLEYLEQLKTVAIQPGSHDAKTVEALRGTVHNMGLEFGVVLGGELYPDTQQSLHVSDITGEELELLPYLSGMKELVLKDPKAEPEKVFALGSQLTGVTVSWEVTLGDQIYDAKTTAVDLTMAEITDLSEVEQKLAYLPDLESVTFGVCGVDEASWGNSKSKLTASPIENEDMAAYRDRVREDYRVVWTVRLGPSIALRTDADNFMPNHFGVGQLPDSYAYNLRYCEEMVCLDVGHMTLTDISFVEYMPNLKYLILAWTEVKYIEPIRTCKNLVFLELDNSTVRDISPLVDCTALEDLNLGRTYCSVEPILGMTWLKNVYMIRRGSAGVVGQALPDTRVVTSADETAATVGYGWRRLPNYYAMRDCLNAPYMN